MTNKKVVMIIGMILLIAGVTYATGVVLFGETSDKGNISASSIESGLVGHWALDSESYNSVTGRVTDKTPYENHGTNYGATLTTDRMGHSNGAMNFDGNDYIDASLDLSWDETKNISISFWVNPMSDTISQNGVVGKIGGGWEWSIYQNSKSLNLVYWDTTGNHANGMDDGWGNVLTAGNWTYITYTWNSTTSLFYANGVLVNTHVATNPSSNQDRASNIAIGGNIYTWGVKYWNGSLADIMIYNRTLSPTEISVLYNSYNPKLSSGSLQTGLVFDMPLTSDWTKTEVAGSEIMTDKTPYSNDGQNYGASVGVDSTSFDGTADYIDVVDNQILMPDSQITLAVWAKKDGNGNQGGRGIMASKYTTYIDTCYSNQVLFSLRTSSQNLIQGGACPLVGVWTHYVATYNGNIARLYLNGIQVSNNVSINGAIADGVNSLTIGKYDGGSYNFNGSISSLKIYNRALSDSEIKLLYDKGR